MSKVLKFIASVVITVLMSALMALIFIEWMVGCGESYIDSKGVRHANECLIINLRK